MTWRRAALTQLRLPSVPCRQLQRPPLELRLPRPRAPSPPRVVHVFVDSDSSDDDAATKADDGREAKFNPLGTIIFDVWDCAKRRGVERDMEQRQLRRAMRRSLREHQARLGFFVVDYSDDTSDNDNK